MYTTLETLSIAIGTCHGCPFDDDQVWTGTVDHGPTHSRIPLPGDVLDIVQVTYPHVVAPGERFSPEVTVIPRAPFELREDRGDFLSHLDADDGLRFGAWQLIPVRGTIASNQPFTFVDRDSPFTAPSLTPGEHERTLMSTWRVWMYTRYVGPPIRITFTVRTP